MNLKVVLFLVGLAVGAVLGYLTRPEAAEIRLGPLSVEVQGDRVAQGGGPMTSGQWQYLAIFTAIGGVVGAAAGFVLDRRRV
jgi:hypothetical protein